MNRGMIKTAIEAAKGPGWEDIENLLARLEDTNFFGGLTLAIMEGVTDSISKWSILSEIDQHRIQAEIGFVESLRAYAQELINLEKGMTDEQES